MILKILLSPEQLAAYRADARIKQAMRTKIADDHPAVVVTQRDVHELILSDIRADSRAREQAQIERNRAWEAAHGRRLGEEEYVDEQGNVHDPLGYRLQQARHEFFDR